MMKIFVKINDEIAVCLEHSIASRDAEKLKDNLLIFELFFTNLKSLPFNVFFRATKILPFCSGRISRHPDDCRNNFETAVTIMSLPRHFLSYPTIPNSGNFVRYYLPKESNWENFAQKGLTVVYNTEKKCQKIRDNLC